MTSEKSRDGLGGVSRLLGFFEAGFERVGDLLVLVVGWFGG